MPHMSSLVQAVPPFPPHEEIREAGENSWPSLVLGKGEESKPGHFFVEIYEPHLCNALLGRVPTVTLECLTLGRERGLNGIPRVEIASYTNDATIVDHEETRARYCTASFKLSNFSRNLEEKVILSNSGFSEWWIGFS